MHMHNCSKYVYLQKEELIVSHNCNQNDTSSSTSMNNNDNSLSQTTLSVEAIEYADCTTADE